MAAPPAQVSPAGFDRLYGLAVVQLDERRGEATVAVHDDLKRPDGRVHGGVYAAIAEGLAIVATEAAVEREGRSAVALSCQTSLLQPIADGTIHATAVARHRGRTTWVWEVEITDDRGQLCAVGRVTIAARLPSAS